MSMKLLRPKEVPYGYCHCGCGERTNIAAKTSPKYGSVRGEPNRYISGHQSRTQISNLDILAERMDGNEADCWEWIGRIRDGYGYVTANGKYQFAHRAMYERYKGPIPDSLHLDHLCCNSLCVNPFHLEAVTRYENNRRQSNVKLSMGKAREIRTRATTGETKAALAREYDVCDTHIGKIVRGEAWPEEV